MTTDVRILLLADTHLGFDLPVRPRVERRRRGHDFFANYRAALEPALAGQVDLVVHAGDLFDRPTVSPSLAYQAYEPLRCLADLGVPVFIVPGNHERSRLPHPRFASHPLLHVFHHASTFVVDVRGTTIALSGFPYERRNVRGRFAELLEKTEWRRARAALRVLCIHHCVEGATVGPHDFTFTTGDDVIGAGDVPPDFNVVLSGHIHRHQVLMTDLRHRPVKTPVLYPGSIERTSFAEAGETKGFMLVRLGADEHEPRVRWDFRRLPARPMLREELAVDAMDAVTLEAAVHAIITAAPRDAVLSIRIAGALTDEHWRTLSAQRMRSFVPTTMNVEIAPVMRLVRQQVLSSPSRRTESYAAQLSLYDGI